MHCLEVIKSRNDEAVAEFERQLKAKAKGEEDGRIPVVNGSNWENGLGKTAHDGKLHDTANVATIAASVGKRRKSGRDGK